MKLPNLIIYVVGIGLILYGVYTAIENYHPNSSEEKLKKTEFFCNNKKTTVGYLNDTMSVMTIRQRESKSYDYNYTVDGRQYKVENVSFGGKKNENPPLENVVYYLDQSPNEGTTIDPCILLKNRKRGKENKWKSYLGIFCVLFGYILNKVARRIKF